MSVTSTNSVVVKSISQCCFWSHENWVYYAFFLNIYNQNACVKMLVFAEVCLGLALGFCMSRFAAKVKCIIQVA